MRSLIVAALPALAMLGCANPYAELEQQAKQAAHYEAVTMCDQQGQTAQWKDNCYKMVMLRRQNEFIASVRQDQAMNQARVSQALMGASNAVMAASPPPPPINMARPVNCTSYPVGGTVQTNCR